MADEFLNMVKSVQSTGKAQLPQDKTGQPTPAKPVMAYISPTKLMTESADSEMLYRFNTDSKTKK